MHRNESIFQNAPNPLVHTCWVCGSCTLSARHQNGSGLIPYVLLRGHWLATYGFVIGARLRVDVRHEHMTIRVVEAPQPAASRIPSNFRHHHRARSRRAARECATLRRTQADEPPSWMHRPLAGVRDEQRAGGRHG